jgi:hypothetical protein
MTPARKRIARWCLTVFRHFDDALKPLAEHPPAERVPVYALRILAMELAGAKLDAV